jgi:hypothetical protein
MDCAAVIRIRYKDFWSEKDILPGLHGNAVRRGTRVTVYLQPGLTGGQRAAVFRRLRQEASRGCGPELPLARLVLAAAADRMRTGTRVVGGAVRLHPGVTLLPSVLAVLVMTMFVLASAGEPPAARASGGGSALAGDQPGGTGLPAVITAQGTVAAGGRGLAQAERAVPAEAKAKGRAACLNVMIGRDPSPSLQLACRHAASNSAHRPGPHALAW